MIPLKQGDVIRGKDLIQDYRLQGRRGVIVSEFENNHKYTEDKKRYWVAFEDIMQQQPMYRFMLIKHPTKK